MVEGRMFQAPKVYRALFETEWDDAYLAGGRGSGKTVQACYYCLRWMRKFKSLCLVLRRLQNSIKDSSKAEIEKLIHILGWDRFFEITHMDIICKETGSRMAFKGLEKNTDSLRSMSGIGLLLCEESQAFSRLSWDDFSPTVRDAGSKILTVINPRYKNDIVYEEMMAAKKDGSALVIKANLEDNPYKTERLMRKRERDRRRMDPDMFAHVWEGKLLTFSSDLVISPKIWRIAKKKEKFPVDAPLHFGLDLGYAHPTAAVAARKIGNRLIHVIGENVQPRGGVPANKLENFVRRVGADDGDEVNMDISLIRPPTDSMVKFRHVPKGSGSVDRGLNIMRDYDFIIDRSCVNLVNNLENFRYVRDPQTGDITDKIDKTRDDVIDALRYAVFSLHKSERKAQRRSSFGRGSFGVYENQLETGLV